MAQPAPLLRMTYAEYLVFERESEVKQEYLRGEVFVLAGRVRRDDGDLHGR